MTTLAEGIAGTGSAPEESTRVSLSQQIYDVLREGIIRGQYPQGSRLAEQRLAMELGVSRVPLREAVPLLEIDGFIATLPRRGAVVTTWSIGSANELFDLRLCLEVGAARYAARMAGQGATCEPLRKSLLLSSAGIASGDAYRIAQDSADFHKLVVDLTGNTLMRTLMRSVSGRMMWLFFLTSELDENDAYHGHQELAAAIESGNERVAEAVAYAHIERDRVDSLRTMAAHGTR
ncbi:MAG: transcriptional regulator, GntR family [Pseudonocardiales bacterium]|nr:transcriptional regulator, GntR family [Pseudonocardiales bacterium]